MLLRCVKPQTLSMGVESINVNNSHRLETMGRLAGGVAHDFNNILTAMYGYLELVRGQIEPHSKAADYVAEIKRAADRATDLTRQLLLFGRAVPGERGVIDLNEAITGLIRMLDRLIGERVHIVTRLAPEVPEVLGNVTKVEQVIMNLVINARDAMPDGGTIEITTTVVNAADLPDSVAPQNGRLVVLTITDTGIGMDEETVQRIHEPFFTTKEPGRGTGLGLPVVFGIVKEMNGWVSVTSQPGIGTSFTVILPENVATQPEPRPDPNPAGVSSRGTARVLLVDDDPDILKACRIGLPTYGFHCDTAGTVHEAIAKLRSPAVPYDVVVSDMVLPDGSGTDLMHTSHGCRQQSFVFISGYSNNRSDTVYVCGDNRRLLQKPFTLPTLASAIHDAPRNLRLEKECVV